jgi:ADP-L-glycero-D-manno-heptose 6-epimerase
MAINKRILLTGAAGFIGSYLLGYLNHLGYQDIIIADDFSDEDKWFNFDSKQFAIKIHRDELFDWLENEKPQVDFVFHLGARTDTAEFDYSVHERLNVDYSKKVWNFCSSGNIPLVYASSAATYGSGENGYSDDHGIVESLQPLNPYGVSKNEFDKWVLGETITPPTWAGLKFFNVYGPNEYHKARMASMVFHGYNQARKTGVIKLFKSHRNDYQDGQQLRDFIYVKDVVKVCAWMMEQSFPSGLYNVGTGQARSFNDLASATFSAMGLPANISYIDMPVDIRDKYQYFTEAEMGKLRAAGYTDPFYSLEEGVKEYVQEFLQKQAYY